MNEDILRELNSKIEILENNINSIRVNINNETNEMNDLKSQIDMLQSKFDSKKVIVSQITKKINEKTLILTEARRAYSKVII